MPYVPTPEALNLSCLDVGTLVEELGPPPWRKPLVASASARVVLTSVAPKGSPHPLHHHPRAEEVFYIVRGTGRLMLGEDLEYPVRPGSLSFVPRGVRHTITASDAEPLIWISVVAPNEDAPDTEVVDGPGGDAVNDRDSVDEPSP
jgi:mannose-6-phosphate isomerase-like protein (cupin superfamily)